MEQLLGGTLDKQLAFDIIEMMQSYHKLYMAQDHGFCGTGAIMFSQHLKRLKDRIEQAAGIADKTNLKEVP